MLIFWPLTKPTTNTSSGSEIESLTIVKLTTAEDWPGMNETVFVCKVKSVPTIIKRIIM